MTKQEKIWAIGLGFGTLVLITLAFVYRRQIKKGLSKFKKNIIDIANEEWNAWNSDGVIKEGDSRTMDRLRSYWREGGNVNWSDQEMINEAWSSAFISYVMNKGGAGEQFPRTIRHSEYIRMAIKNRKENNDNPFKGYKPSEKQAKVKVGDIVCYPRQSGVGYDSTSSYQSHCDLITEIKDGEAISIGGNVSNSVTKTKVPLTKEGYIDKARDKKSYGGYFVVIKNNKK